MGTRELIVELLSRGTSVRFQASGDSMHPAIRSGDEVTVAPVTSEALLRGDIVLWSNTSGRLIVHRVVECHRGADGNLRIVTRGDNAPSDDGETSSVLGRVIAVTRRPESGFTKRVRSRLRLAAHSLSLRLAWWRYRAPASGI